MQDQVDAQEKPCAAHFADECVRILQPRQLGFEVIPHLERVQLQLFVTQHLEHRDARGARHRITAERAEKFHAIGERYGDLLRGNHRGQRKRIANRFTEHHNVRDHALRLESPEMRPQAPKAHLHFVGDTHRPGRPHVSISLRQIICGKHNLPADARQRFGDERGDLSPARFGFTNHGRHRFGVFFSRPRIVAAERTAIIVRQRRHMYPRFLAAASRPVKFVRADVDERARMPVIGMVQHHNVFAPGMRTRQAQRQFIRLAPGIDEVADAQRRRQQLRQPRGIACGVVVQVARIGVQQRQLFLRGARHARVTVPHQRHIVVYVQIRPAGFVIKVLLPATHDFQRLIVRDVEIFPQQLVSCRQRFLECGRQCRKIFLRNIQ